MTDNADNLITPAANEAAKDDSATGPVCIVGAHRSGTSMLARLMHECGLYLGEDRDLMAAAADNPDGFWENLRFVKLNDEILNTSGGAWDLPPPEDQPYGESDFSALRIRAQLLIDSFKGRQPWGWKDPRNCLTIRFWRKLIPDLKVVIIVRNPLEAAYSMHKRNGVSYALSLRLWEIYNRRILAVTDDMECVVTSYDRFFVEPELALSEIADFTRLDLAKVTKGAALVSRHRRNTTFTLDQIVSAGVSERIVELYQALLNQSRGLARADRETSGSQEAIALLPGSASRLNTAVPDGEEIRQELATRRGDEIRFREEASQLKDLIESLRHELAAASVKAAGEIALRDGRIEELQKAYAHLDNLFSREQEARNTLYAVLESERRDAAQRLLELERERQHAAQSLLELERERQHVAEQNATLEQLRDRFAQTNQLLHTQSIQLQARDSEASTLAERLRKQLTETKRLLRLLDDTELAAKTLGTSRRWALANPFAWLRASLSGRKLRGFGHLDKVVAKYHAWRSARPELADLNDEIAKLRSGPKRFSPSPETGVFPGAEKQSRPRPVIIERSIAFPTPDRVEVSIIIPAFNQVDFTLACLDSVQQHTAEPSYEVIIVDDCSTDDTQRLMRQITGLRYLRADKNAGFTASCNRGAQAGKGKYLIFLNNDTTVTDGWLTSLLETYELEPKAGLVGSKLVYPDGRLQEAGGIIWRDGSGWNRGKFQDPSLPEFNFLCEVDYCSAASVIIPRSLFEEVGGFDEKYSPAYYEDTDLAFKVAEAGHKVLYQPLSVVVHHEGATAGIDVSAGAKRYQEINRATFVATWEDRLSNKPMNGDVLAWEAPAEGCQRILVIDHHLPLTNRDSGSLRMSQILNILHSLGHRVTFIPDNLADIPPYGDELRKRGIEVVHHPYIKSVSDYLQINGSKYDTVLLSRRDFARKHIESVRQHAPQAKLIFDTVDLHFLREEREAALAADASLKAKAAEMRQLEYDLVERADATWVVSPVEQELLRVDFPHKSIEVVSNIVPIDESPMPFAGRRDLLFIGSFLHDPNVDAVVYFVREILPAVTAQLPEAKFYIIGDKAPPEVIALASEKVIIAGHQPDLRPYFDTVRLSVAPLRYGAGVKGKINQSMGLGVPVVATSLAVEGMSLQAGKDIMVADTPAAFAEAIIKVYLSEPDWNRLSENGREKTRALFSAAAARKHLKRLLAERGKIPRTMHVDGKDYSTTPAMS